MELSCYRFNIEYRPGKENVSADALSRCASVSIDKLFELHQIMCHPGITRFYHYIRTKNLPYSLDEIKRVTNGCSVCRECKPQYIKPEHCALIKATQPFERLNIDFKGPLQSTNNNKYFLMVVDEFSRYPFVFPCQNLTSSTVINCLSQLFVLFGVPSYIHSDRGASFLSEELRTFLVSRGVASSRTTPYNPRGNGQAEKYNATVWKTISLALRAKNLPAKYWQAVLPDALHSVRSLLCTATNSTPHERFLGFPRKSTTGQSIPSWLTDENTVLLKRQARQCKTDPFVDEVEVLQVNPRYAYIRHANGRENTESLRNLAPKGDLQPLRQISMYNLRLIWELQIIGEILLLRL